MLINVSPDGVCRRQLCHGDVAGSFVGHQGILRSFFPVVASRKLSQVPVEVDRIHNT